LRSLNIAIVISALVHLCLFLLMAYIDRDLHSTHTAPIAIEWVELQSDSLDQSRQIVQQDDTINDRIPEKDYKLSRSNQDVLKETKAQRVGEYQNRKNQVEGKTSSQESTQSQAQQQKEARQTALNQFKPDLYDDSFHPNKLKPAGEPGRTGAEISQSDDYLDDVILGAETLLKTREFVYYSYYDRIKKQLRHHWEPRIKDKIIKILRQGRTIASVNHKITRLVITLDHRGELIRIQVRNASGYNDLDDAAIEAFRAAAPFPNPPEGIVNNSGQVEINWDFVLET
jgi:TonB family protein